MTAVTVRPTGQLTGDHIVADTRGKIARTGSAEIWSSRKTPTWAIKEGIAILKEARAGSEGGGRPDTMRGVRMEVRMTEITQTVFGWNRGGMELGDRTFLLTSLRPGRVARGREDTPVVAGAGVCNCWL